MSEKRPVQLTESELKVGMRGMADLVRGALFVLGVLAIVLGVVALVAPHKTLWLVAVIFGVYFMLAGIVRAIAGIAGSVLPGGLRIFLVVLGVLLVAGGIVILFNPHVGVLTIAILVGASWIIDGIAGLASIPAGASKAVPIVVGVVQIVAGLVVLFVPTTAAVVFVLVGGVVLVIVGIFAVGAGIVLGRRAKQAIAAV